MSELYVCWEWPFESRPSDLWPLVSNTDRFNAESGLPFVEQLGQSGMARRLRLSRLGVKVEWEEQPFEWLRPERFGVLRRYNSGPLREMRVLTELSDNPRRLRYQVWATPRNWLGRALVKLQLMESARRFAKTVRAYDARASKQSLTPSLPHSVRLAEGGSERIERARRQLLAENADERLVARLCAKVREESDLDVYRLRPYSCADEWGAARRDVTELFLRATRAGLLEFQWELLCPLCRGAKQKASELCDVDPRVHCEACNIDFNVDFDRSVELTFHPSAAVREVDVYEYCVGGPQNTPHVFLQQILRPGEHRTVEVALETGLYRFRGWGETKSRMLRAVAGGLGEAFLDDQSSDELIVSTQPRLMLSNSSSEDRVVLLERLAWSEQAATAADVTAMQVFRDLFSTEALRPDLPMTVGNITVMFTDLEGSADLYRTLGDSVAFSRVLTQQKILAEAVEAEGGAVIKTIGDRGMAVFRRPISAIRAAIKTQRAVSSPTAPMRLKVGIHAGPAIAVTLNGRLDYFGQTVNIGARIASLSNGESLVASETVCLDPEVHAWLNSGAAGQQSLDVPRPGNTDESLQLFCLSQRTDSIRNGASLV